MAAIPHSTELATVDGERAEDPLDPLIRPEIYDGVIVRRVVAYLVDLIIIALATLLAMATFAVLGVLSFGVLSPALAVMLPLIPLTYHTAFIGAPASATLGMRLFALEVRRIEGGRPGYLQAAPLTIVFYVTVGVTSVGSSFSSRCSMAAPVPCTTTCAARSSSGGRSASRPEPYNRSRIGVNSASLLSKAMGSASCA